MGTGQLTIDLDAIAANWSALDAASGSGTETGAVVKANGYGLGAGRVARALAHAGARRFFVAHAEEGATIRNALGRGPEIYVFAGHMRGDTDMLSDLDLIPMINSIDQLTRHFEAIPEAPFGIQLDTGMNRLGMEPAEWAAVRELVIERSPRLVMSHLASADDVASPQNDAQVKLFRELTAGCGIPRSFANTGGILLGPEYHFELTRPGIGLYGGLPFAEARPVVQLDLKVIQTGVLRAGESVGYNATFTAEADTPTAAVFGGYGDGILRALSNSGALWADGVACPILGRVSMDAITVDISGLTHEPRELSLLCAEQGIDAVARDAGTIPYEILTALGPRYNRRYAGRAG